MLQAWQHEEDMKKRIVTNALCSWAEAVALSAGEDIDLCRRSCTEATIEVFQNIRQVSALTVTHVHCSDDLACAKCPICCKCKYCALQTQQQCLHDVPGTTILADALLLSCLQKYSFQVKRRLIDEASSSDSTAHLENMVSGFVSLTLSLCDVHSNPTYLCPYSNACW